ncbi:MAG: hypothetical protein SNJ74_07635, partial [Fimbriimonadaceae bacterium]
FDLLYCMFVRILLALLLSVACVAAAPASDRIIAHLGVVTTATQAFADNGMQEAVVSLAPGDKLVVLSRSQTVARILRTDGRELFVPLPHVRIAEPVTLRTAIDRIRFFERMRSSDPAASAYYDEQAGPWVALVARQLAIRNDAGELPDLDRTGWGGDTLPTLELKNNTSYSLRVYLVGPRTVTRTIAPRSTLTEDFAPGTYRVVVETTSGDVTPLRTNWKLETGYVHSITLYIETTTVPVPVRVPGRRR